MSGFHEILLIGAIVAGIVLLPRITGRRAAPRPSAPGVHRGFKRFSGMVRLGIVLSMVWLAACAAILDPWRGAWSSFLLWGGLPIVAGWGLVWVAAGFRRDGRRRKHLR